MHDKTVKDWIRSRPTTRIIFTKEIKTDMQWVRVLNNVGATGGGGIGSYVGSGAHP